MRKFISMILAVCLLMSFALPAMATEEAHTVTPRYSHTSAIEGSLAIDSSGTATCTASGTAKSTAHKVYLTCQLQGYTGTYWSVRRSWTVTGTYSASLSKTATTSSDYLDYRVQVTCKIYDSSNTLLESVTIYQY